MTSPAHETPAAGSRLAYRPEIDALRAIAVFAVMAFHAGYLANGYLGVDVFFVISGYLITSIVANDAARGRGFIARFYVRRIRRIIPLSLFIAAVALVLGVATMLPDDLENLSASVVATNLFANNVLQLITTRNYFDVLNDYKPLMHTWSLGVEEQFYVFYPLLFLLPPQRVILVLSSLTAISLALLYGPFDLDEKFYLLPFRFHELAIGGLAALVLQGRQVTHRWWPVVLLGLLLLILIGPPILTAQAALLVVVVATTGLLILRNETHWAAPILSHPLLVGLGVISYSLYMWHQVLLAYARYAVVSQVGGWHAMLLVAATIALSIVTYRFVEQPFRDPSRVSTRVLLAATGSLFVVVTGAALYVYARAGVVRDVPELAIAGTDRIEGHAAYRLEPMIYDREFPPTERLKVLVLGNSFARDWVNVLEESSHRHRVEISIRLSPQSAGEIRTRVADADLIFASAPTRELMQRLEVDTSKLWALGTKNFGTSNGLFYNHRGPGYYEQRTTMQAGYFEINESVRAEWGPRFIDLIGKVIDDQRRVPVFTPTRQFISNDTRHFTKAGAEYFATLMHGEIDSILRQAEQQRR